MKHIIFVVPFLLNSINGSAQGGWNIGYIPVDSIQSLHIGQSFQLDFKHPGSFQHQASHSPLAIRQRIAHEDTAFITMGCCPKDESFAQM